MGSPYFNSRCGEKDAAIGVLSAMLRILGFILAFYVVCFAVVDTTWYGGRFSRAILQEANYRANRTTVEVRYQLDKIGIWARSANIAAPSRADEGR
jgi:hypothetical protein